jgi:hypothetical protein
MLFLRTPGPGNGRTTAGSVIMTWSKRGMSYFGDRWGDMWKALCTVKGIYTYLKNEGLRLIYI